MAGAAVEESGAAASVDFFASALAGVAIRQKAPSRAVESRRGVMVIRAVGERFGAAIKIKAVVQTRSVPRSAAGFKAASR